MGTLSIIVSINSQLIIIFVLFVKVHARAAHQLTLAFLSHLNLVMVLGELVGRLRARLQWRLASLLIPLTVLLDLFKQAAVIFYLRGQVLSDVGVDIVLFDVRCDGVVQSAEQVDIQVDHSVGQKLDSTVRKVPREYAEQDAKNEQ